MPIVNFNTKEKEFLNSNEWCRIDTCHDNIPHVVPVSYVFEDDLFFFLQLTLRPEYRNLIKNSRIALVVDSYSSVGNKAICVQVDQLRSIEEKNLVDYTKYSIETSNGSE